VTCVVFLGPSLPLADARAILDADYRPPARGCDVLEAACDAPDAIVLIDGLFEQVPSVRHKEVLYALSRGIAVYGAASMGALRAAELTAFGMRGVGQIYEAFASGEYEDDDEVAICHAAAEEQHRPLSEAMANLRWGLSQAAAAGVISAATRDGLVRIGKATFYPERSWGGLVTRARAEGLPGPELEALLDHVRRTRPDRKRDDARLVLKRARDDLARGPIRCAPSFELRLTRRLQRDWMGEVERRRAARAPSAKDEDS
jgi:hypothetical protein